MLLATAAHGVAGGGLPHGAALTLLALAAGVAGTAAAGLYAGPRARRSWANETLTVTTVLVLAQLAGHLALSCGHPVRLGMPMLAAHGFAAAVCALLIVLADRMCTAIARAIHAITHIPAPPDWQTLTIAAGVHQHLRIAWQCLPGAPRGPPIPC